MKINPIQIGVEELLVAAQKYFDENYRLVTITCVDDGEKVRLIYSFDRELALENLEISFTRDQAIPSITLIYPCAFLVENEMKELFGIKIDNIALDLNGRLYLVEGAQEAPMTRTLPAGKGVE